MDDNYEDDREELVIRGKGAQQRMLRDSRKAASLEAKMEMD